MNSKNKSTFIFSLLATSTCLLSLSNTLYAADVISSTESPDIQEPADTYTQVGSSVLDMSVDIVLSDGVCVTGDYTGCTLTQVLDDIDGTDDFKPEVKVHLVVDGLTDNGLSSNATMRQRGLASRHSPQKSFRIKLDSKKKLWRGERRIQLMKSVFDFSRIRNKLSYDLFAEIPHLPSMKTQFVKLTVNNQTEVNGPRTSEDYGLFTHAEYFGKEYLVRRGWDKDSRVYKAEAFEFYEESALAIDALTGKPVNEDAFEEVLEIKRGDTHHDLANMLRDLNDPLLDFNTQVMGKYFNRDNYLTWLAVNILLNNTDTNYHNYYLFNPKGNEHFYLVPWDYDISLGSIFDDPKFTPDQYPRWWFSHASWWNISLHRNFLSQPGNLNLLKLAVNEIRTKYLTPAKIQEKTSSYYDNVFPLISQNPDWRYLYVQGGTDPERVADYNRIFSNLANNVELNYMRFLKHADNPMTFGIRDASFLGNHDILFKWSKSVSLINQSIGYDLEVSTTKTFDTGTIVETISNITDTQYTLHWTHPKGTYFYRVRSKDLAKPLENWQESHTDDGHKYEISKLPIFGIKDMYVAIDGDTNPPPSNSVSNPVSSISINGDNADWAGLTLFPTDPDDIANSSTNIIDWKNAGIAHNDQNLYFLYNNYGSIHQTKTTGQYISWGYQAFLDTDKNPLTGFKYSDVLGANYLMSGNSLYRYTGSGSDWNWTYVADANSRYNDNTEEYEISRNLLGNPSSFYVVFDGRNAAFGGSTIDQYPDGSSSTTATVKYFEYSFGTIVPPGNHAPLAVSKTISLIENTKVTINLEATDADNDPLTLTIVSQPTHGSLTVSASASSLVVEYQPNQNYKGNDSFTFKVNDGTVFSNVSTISLQVNPKPPSSIISNHVVSGGITVNGSSSDWSNLTLFASDPDDIPSGANNVIDWESAGIAHSSDTVYFLYKNHGDIDPGKPTGAILKWGWQIFIDTDNSIDTGFKVTGTVGAEYMLEGNEIFKYTGINQSWDWINIGIADAKYANNIAELSFPRSLMNVSTQVKVAYYGNNRAYGGTTRDRYPDHKGFSYNFGSGVAGKAVHISSQQAGVTKSPENHNLTPVTAVVTPVAVVATPQSSSKGGGNFSWLMLFLTSLFLLRRRKV